jgi:hypothetical protein
MRYFLFTLSFVFCIFTGCNSPKNEDSIAFVRLHTSVLYDTLDNPYLNINQYAEYRFSNRDSLFIGISGDYDYFDVGCRIDTEKPFHFGLKKFCTNKIDKEFSELMAIILNGKFEESYRKQLGGNRSTCVDDREGVMFIINKNGKQRFISYYEDYLLPEELRKADSLIAEQINLSLLVTDKANYTPHIILSLQDFFQEYLPPPPIISTVEFTLPVIETVDSK